MSVLGTIVDTKALLQTVVASLIAGIGVTFVFSLLVFGAARGTDLRRDDRQLLAAGAGLLSVLAFAVTIGAVVFGIIVMAHKS